jgi:hypothetical protein
MTIHLHVFHNMQIILHTLLELYLSWQDPIGSNWLKASPAVHVHSVSCNMFHAYTFLFQTDSSIDISSMDTEERRLNLLQKVNSSKEILIAVVYTDLRNQLRDNSSKVCKIICILWKREYPTFKDQSNILIWCK